MLSGGEGGIRTLEPGVTGLTVFETAAFNHSATSPRRHSRQARAAVSEYSDGPQAGQSSLATRRLDGFARVSATPFGNHLF